MQQLSKDILLIVEAIKRETKNNAAAQKLLYELGVMIDLIGVIAPQYENLANTTLNLLERAPKEGHCHPITIDKFTLYVAQVGGFALCQN